MLLGRLAPHPVDRVVIGMADANRSLDFLVSAAVADNGGVGNFLSIVPLLLDMPPDHPRVDYVLKKTRDRILLAMSDAAVSFQAILEQAHALRSHSHSPHLLGIY